MNINLQIMSLVIGGVVGILAMLTIRNPIVSLLVALIATGLTEGILRLQSRE